MQACHTQGLGIGWRKLVVLTPKIYQYSIEAKIKCCTYLALTLTLPYSRTLQGACTTCFSMNVGIFHGNTKTPTYSNIVMNLNNVLLFNLSSVVFSNLYHKIKRRFQHTKEFMIWTPCIEVTRVYTYSCRHPQTKTFMRCLEGNLQSRTCTYCTRFWGVGFRSHKIKVTMQERTPFDANFRNLRCNLILKTYQ